MQLTEDHVDHLSLLLRLNLFIALSPALLIIIAQTDRAFPPGVNLIKLLGAYLGA